MVTVEQGKTALRITNDQLDDAVQLQLDAALLDLGTAGVHGRYDALTDTAVELYLKWRFDFLGKGEQFGRAYQDLKTLLSLAGDYNGGGA